MNNSAIFILFKHLIFALFDFCLSLWVKTRTPQPRDVTQRPTWGHHSNIWLKWREKRLSNGGPSRPPFCFSWDLAQDNTDASFSQSLFTQHRQFRSWCYLDRARASQRMMARVSLRQNVSCFDQRARRTPSREYRLCLVSLFLVSWHKRIVREAEAQVTM